MSFRELKPWFRICLPVVVGLVIVAAGIIFYNYDAAQITATNSDRETNRMRVFTQLTARDFESVISDLSFLSDGDGLHAYLASGQQADLNRAIRRAVFMTRMQSDYDQLRYLDDKGQEIFRVNAGGVIVPAGDLQNKADRPYFKNTFALPSGAMFISPFDLNLEHGEVEQPFKPMIRFASPVFDATGRVRGVYVINVTGGNIIDELHQFSPVNFHRLRLLNSSGYWLLDPSQPRDEWGFMLPDRADLTLAKTDPTLWAKITSQPDGQVPYQGGLFTWHRFVPAGVKPGNYNRIVSGDDYLVFASQIPAPEWDALFFDMRSTLISASCAVMLLALLGAWLRYQHFRAQEALRQNEQRLHLMIDNIKDYAIIMLNPDGRIVTWNAGAERIKGYRAEEIIGSHFSRFYPEEAVREGLPETILRVAAAQGRAEDEGWRLRKDGSHFWANVSISAIRSPEGRLLGFVKVTRDQTERKKIESQNEKLTVTLQERATELEAVNKELEAFSYSVSHDLRAPLRHVDGFVDLLVRQSSGKLEEKEKRYLQIVSDAARQMGALIDDLLVFSRMGRSEMRLARVSMDMLVNEARKNLEPDTKDRHIDWKVGPLPVVHGDMAMLRQVWLNLIGNAIKYTRTRDPAVIEIGAREEEAEHVFFVRDNGVGFDMRYVHKLFGVFQRLHRADEFEGTGIGLANVRRIVARHRGRTWAEGEPGRGATFFFSLLKNPE